MSPRLAEPWPEAVKARCPRDGATATLPRLAVDGPGASWSGRCPTCGAGLMMDAEAPKSAPMAPPRDAAEVSADLARLVRDLEAMGPHDLRDLAREAAANGKEYARPATERATWRRLAALLRGVGK